MTKKIFLAGIITAHIVFIFLHIHTYSGIIKQSYKKQKNEHLILTLEQKKQQLTQQIYALKNQNSIKEFAASALHFEPVTLTQVRRINR